MRVMRACRVGLGAGVLLATGWALAQEPTMPAADDPICTRTPTEADLEGAKGAHKAAIQFYERADYDRAIRYWNDAYEFDCTAHGVLINIASAYERKGDRAAAVATLETYLTRAPDAPDALTIQERVQNLQAVLKAEQERRTPPPVTTTPPPVVVKPPPPQPEMVRPYGYAPLVLAGAGGAAVAVGAILLPIGLSTISAAEKDCGGGRTNCDPVVADKGNRGRSQVAIGGVVMGAGALAVGGGLAWHFIFNKPVPVYPTQGASGTASSANGGGGSQGSEAAPPPGPSIDIAPSVGYGFGGLSISGSF
ncbi:tetratricopeptide repeat protein [Chondromyces crocatus]|uniref:Uncharacterized protein n=1 Tax=Chondromyces crocatus TaxID=52 RepID=A0A0K1EM09_CHOCO|nr:tetratricopeptide repeat protein [Chondromyces crocatus]AKT41894.1 uncharacterized protein CMC5_061160 [Chondromyces crocatus]